MLHSCASCFIYNKTGVLQSAFFFLQMSMCCLATLCVVIVGSDPLPSFFLRTVSRGRRCHSGKDADKKEREEVWGRGGILQSHKNPR